MAGFVGGSSPDKIELGDIEQNIAKHMSEDPDSLTDADLTETEKKGKASFGVEFGNIFQGFGIGEAGGSIPEYPHTGELAGKLASGEITQETHDFLKHAIRSYGGDFKVVSNNNIPTAIDDRVDGTALSVREGEQDVNSVRPVGLRPPIWLVGDGVNEDNELVSQKIGPLSIQYNESGLYWESRATDNDSLSIQNSFAGEIPAHGVMEITAVDSSGAHWVRRPDADNLVNILVNDSSIIPESGTARIRKEWPKPALMTGSPSVGDEIGTASGSFNFETGKTGFINFGLSGSKASVRPSELETIKVKNDYSGSIPAYGAMEVTSVDADNTHHVVRPTAADLKQILINDSSVIGAGSTIKIKKEWPKKALLTGSPSVGDELGTTASSFNLSTGQIGFVNYGAVGGRASVRPFDDFLNHVQSTNIHYSYNQFAGVQIFYPISGTWYTGSWIALTPGGADVLIDSSVVSFSLSAAFRNFVKLKIYHSYMPPDYTTPGGGGNWNPTVSIAIAIDARLDDATIIPDCFTSSTTVWKEGIDNLLDSGDAGVHDGIWAREFDKLFYSINLSAYTGRHIDDVRLKFKATSNLNPDMTAFLRDVVIQLSLDNTLLMIPNVTLYRLKA